MLLETRRDKHVDKWGYEHLHDVNLMQCDTCGAQWETRVSKAKLLSAKTHACSQECKKIAHKPGGVAAEAKRVTNLARFGVENPFVAEACKQKAKATWLKRYGVEHGPSAPEVRAKAHQTSVERYGERPIASEMIQSKIKQTMFERHGVERPMQLARVREAMQVGSIAKHGVPYPMQNRDVMNAALDKRFETVQTQGDQVYSSRPEIAFYGLLVEKFGAADVLVQQRLTRKWSIDFYIRSISTYVQFDGIYWHGLDRPLDVIRASTKRRDQAIYGKWIKDRALDAYVSERGLRLVRITDVMFKNDPQGCVEAVQRKQQDGPPLPDAERV